MNPTDGLGLEDDRGRDAARSAEQGDGERGDGDVVFILGERNLGVVEPARSISKPMENRMMPPAICSAGRVTPSF